MARGHRRRAAEQWHHRPFISRRSGNKAVGTAGHWPMLWQWRHWAVAGPECRNKGRGTEDAESVEACIASTTAPKGVGPRSDWVKGCPLFCLPRVQICDNLSHLKNKIAGNGEQNYQIGIRHRKLKMRQNKMQANSGV